MIYITGDTHIPIDISKLNVKNFPEQIQMSKADYLIICGDFGGVWNNSAEDIYWRKWLNEKNFITLFVDGNHENFDLLKKYPVNEWNGGKVHFIEKDVIHLMRGQVFNIDGLKFFTMGGATSIDKEWRREHISWWADEIPSMTEMDEGLGNLWKNNNEVDYVISHTTSRSNMEKLGYVKEQNTLNTYFDILEREIKYKKWYFGHFHDNVNIDNKHILLYDKIERVC